MKPKFTDAHKYPHGYTNANSTDVAATFKRIQKRIADELAKAAADAAEAQSNIKPIRKGAK